MDQRITDILPERIREMVTEIEKLIGSAIIVRQRNSGDLNLISDPTLTLLDCDMQNGVTTVAIAYPGNDPVPHLLVHEILHAHRNIVKAVYQLKGVPSKASAKKLASMFENDIEHLFIVPEEIALAPESLAYWTSHYDAKVAEVRDTPASPMATRSNLLRHWLVASTVIPKWHGLVGLRHLLVQHRMLGDARKLVQSIVEAKSNKPRCIARLLHSIKLPPEDFYLQRFMVAEKRIDEAKIPFP